MTADLRRYYGVRLSDMYAGKEDPLEVADMLANVPRGGAVHQWTGGWGAITSEDEALRRIEYLMQVQIVQASGKRRSIPAPSAPASQRDEENRAAEVARKKAAKAKAIAAMAERMKAR